MQNSCFFFDYETNQRQFFFLLFLSYSLSVEKFIQRKHFVPISLQKTSGTMFMVRTAVLFAIICSTTSFDLTEISEELSRSFGRKTDPNIAEDARLTVVIHQKSLKEFENKSSRMDHSLKFTFAFHKVTVVNLFLRQ